MYDFDVTPFVSEILCNETPVTVMGLVFAAKETAPVECTSIKILYAATPY